MSIQAIISRDSKPIECERCGREALHVARLIADNGGEVGPALVCIACRRSRPTNAAGQG